MSDYPPPPGSTPSGSTPPGSDDPNRPPPPPPPGWGTPPPPPPPPGGPGGYGPPGYGPPSGGYGPPPGGYGAPPGGYGAGYPTGPGGYSVGNAFRYAFDKFKAHWGPLVLVTVVLLVGVGLVQGAGNVITGAVVPDRTYNRETLQFEGGGGGLLGLGTLLLLFFWALSTVAQMVVQAAIVKGSLDLTRGRKLDVGSAFSGINWGQVVVAALLIGALTFVGLLLCILPGIAVVFFTWFTLYFVIDRNQDAVTAIKSSVTMVKDHLGELILFFLASIAAYVVGVCLCGVGLLVAIPVVVLAQAYTFRTLNDDPVTG